MNFWWWQCLPPPLTPTQKLFSAHYGFCSGICPTLSTWLILCTTKPHYLQRYQSWMVSYPLNGSIGASWRPPDSTWPEWNLNPFQSFPQGSRSRRWILSTTTPPHLQSRAVLSSQSPSYLLLPQLTDCQVLVDWRIPNEEQRDSREVLKVSLEYLMNNTKIVAG